MPPSSTALHVTCRRQCNTRLLLLMALKSASLCCKVLPKAICGPVQSDVGSLSVWVEAPNRSAPSPKRGIIPLVCGVGQRSAHR